MQQMKDMEYQKALEAAREEAVEWSNSFGESNHSTMDLFRAQERFTELVRLFPELKDEFEANGIPFVDMEDEKVQNTLTDRTDIAIALGFGLWPVIPCDEDYDNGYGSLKTYGECRVEYKTKRLPLLIKGQLMKTLGEGYLVSGFGAMVKAEFTAQDVAEMASEANLPILRPGEIILLAHFSKREDKKYVEVMKVSTERVTPHSYTMTRLVEPSEAEMKEVKDRISEILSRS